MKGYWTQVQCGICKKDICRFLCAWDNVNITAMCNDCWEDTYPEVYEGP